MPVPVHSETPQGEINTLLGKGSEFEGKLTFEGTVRIDGKLSGEIFSDDVLVVGEGASVSAEIDVGVIIVEGSVTGNIRAKRAVELHAPARVRGNIETPSLYVDKGVIFEGNCRMEQPQSGSRPTTLDGLAAAAGPKPTGGAAPATTPTPAKK
ncbi:MAG TPA: polymer-forming cytoskeletal protein [Polyangia bacterium]|nr:polymer-forming cytoskeletal protein [Polyangia bacterium]